MLMTSQRSRHWFAFGLCLATLLGTAGCGATGGWVMNNSGMGYYEAGHYAMARHEFAEAVAMAPWNPDYRHNLAMACMRTGDSQRAEAILRHNVTLDAMHQPTYHSLAKLMLESGRQPEAEQLLSSWAGTQSYNPKAHVELAWLQRESGNLPAAEQSLRQAIQLAPQDATVIAQLGQLYQDAGEPQRAAAMYQQSLAYNYGQPGVQSRLAMLERGGHSSGQSFNRMNAVMPAMMGGPSGTMTAAYRPNVATMIASQPVFGSNGMPAGAGMAMNSGWMPATTAPPAHMVQGGIPAGTIQVTPWQYASPGPGWNSAPAMVAAPAHNMTPTLVSSPVPSPTLAPVPETTTFSATSVVPMQPAAGYQTVPVLQPTAPQMLQPVPPATTSAGLTVPAPTSIPALPGVIESGQAISATSTSGVTQVSVQAPVLVPQASWQSAPSTIPPTQIVSGTQPASYVEASETLPTVEPY